MQAKKWLVVILSSSLLFASSLIGTASTEQKPVNHPLSQAANTGTYSTKDEVIYGKLDAHGQVNSVYVVNTFHMEEPGEIIDYGNYANVRNLTNLSDIQVSQQEVHLQADENEFYYQGELVDPSLPWDIDIDYVFEGEQVSPTELPGQSGHLEIKITTSANETIDPLFFKNYLLQISLTLNSAIFDDIQAPKGTTANIGKDKQISFTILPDQTEELIISAHVTDFEMNPIDLSAIPANIAIEAPELGDMTGDMESLSDAINEINTGVAELNSGIAELNLGATQLSGGSREYAKGLRELDQSSTKLITGSKEVQDALQQMSAGLGNSDAQLDLSELADLPAALHELAAAIQESADGLDSLHENYHTAYSTLDLAIDGMPEHQISEAEIQQLYTSETTKEIVDQLVESYVAAQEVKQTYRAVKEGFAAVSVTLEQISAPLHEIAKQLTVMGNEFKQSMEDFDDLDDLEELQKGLSALSSEYRTLHEGFIQYSAGISTLASTYTDIDTGIHTLSKGTGALKRGAQELHSGTEQLQAETNDLPDQMQSKVDELLEEYDNPDFEPISFVSKENEKVDVVQFVLQTEAIKKEESSSLPVEQEETVEKTFWVRFLDLFKW